MKRLNLPYKRTDYSFRPLDHIAKPIVPSDSPATDAAQEKKFKKKVDSSTFMTIRKGRIIPRSIRTMPRPRRRRGEFIMRFFEPLRALSPLRKPLLIFAFLAFFAVNLLIQPTFHKMLRLGLEVRRHLYIAQTRHETRAAWVEAAP